MYRNLYDTDVTVWSPEGRLHQVEYAMEAVKQGSACVGLRSNELVVLAGLKRCARAAARRWHRATDAILAHRRPDELGSYQEKLFRIDDHMGIAISGLTADALVLAQCVGRTRDARARCCAHPANRPLIPRMCARRRAGGSGWSA